MLDMFITLFAMLGGGLVLGIIVTPLAWLVDRYHYGNKVGFLTWLRDLGI